MESTTASINKPRFKILGPKPESMKRVSSNAPRPGNNNVRRVSTCGNGKVELNSLNQCDSEMPKSRKSREPANGKKLQTVLGTKRGPEQQPHSNHVQKRLKTDCGVNEKCYLILRKLMNHKDAWPFLEPVDPIALSIPDYFSIISNPMDLGTIASKLKKNVYREAEEFDSDVRLTFSNAIQYNPPDHDIHQMAKELNKLYDGHWKSLAAMLNRQSITTELQHKVKDNKQFDDVNGRNTKIACADVVQSHSSGSMPSDKVKVSSSMDVPRRMANKAREPQESRIGDSKDSLLKRSSVNTRAPRTSTKPMIKKPSETKKPSDVKNVPVVTSSKKRKTSEKSDVKCSDKSQMSNAYPGSDSSAECLVEEHAYTYCGVTSTSYSAAPADYGSLLSPSKEQRAEMLKKRFAETIFKAQRKTLLQTNAKFDSPKVKQEKERLEQRHSAERARIEAEMKASKIKQETELRNQRQREREAARMALEKMGRSVEFVDNECILRELASLIGDYSFAGPLRGCGGMYVAASKFANGKLKSPLERLGLFLKDDYASIDDFDEGKGNFVQNGDYEEGELIA